MRKNIFFEKIDGKNFKFGIVIARFNPNITMGIKSGCEKALLENDVLKENIEYFEVPGAFELPLVAQKLAKKEKYDAIICLGAIIKGSTPQHQFISEAVSKGLLRVGLENNLPVLFGVLITDDIVQAEERSADDEYNKGREAALSALEMISLIKSRNL